MLISDWKFLLKLLALFLEISFEMLLSNLIWLQKLVLQVTFSWESVTSYGDAFLCGYQLIHNGEPSSTIFTPDVLNATITNLQPGELMNGDEEKRLFSLHILFWLLYNIVFTFKSRELPKILIKYLQFSLDSKE